MYKITLPMPISEKRYGIRFTKGEGFTDNKDIADKLQAMGYLVTPSFNAPIEMPVEVAPAKPRIRKKLGDSDGMAK